MTRRFPRVVGVTALRRWGGVLLLVAVAATSWVTAADDAPTAATLLDEGQKAYTAADYPAAADAFRDFLKRFPKHADADPVRGRLAVCLLALPTPDFAGARDLLQPLATVEGPGKPAALFGLGVAHRGLGVVDLPKARPYFEAAVRQFAAAAQAFRDRVKAIPADGALAADLEWAGQARTLQAELLLRLGQPKEAATVLVALDKEPWLTRAACGSRAAYYQGVTQTMLGNRLAAGRAFGRLRPFGDADLGPRAAYFLGRLQQQDDERAEAALHYRTTLDAFAAHQTADAQADPPRPAAAAPDHVGRAAFFLATLDYEAGRVADAHAHVANFAARYPHTPLSAEARLLQGACEVRLGRAADAVATLQPLTTGPAALRGPALLWLGQAQASSADAEDADAAATARERAAATLGKALECYPWPAPSPTADYRTRRGEVLLALADLHQAAGQYGKTSTLLGQLLDEKLAPVAADELSQRQITALNLARDYAGSEKQVGRFLDAYPKSSFVPEVHFRHAENCVFQAAADKTAAEKLTKEAIRTYRLVGERFPESPIANAARYGLGWLHYQAAEYDKAREQFESIAVGDRTGELSSASFLIADCLIRLAPEQADDAIAAARMSETLRGATELLTSLVAEQPDGPLAPDALLRVGLCQQRLAEALAGEERNQALNAARAACERLLIEYPGSDLTAMAAIERARCIVRQGDPGEAARVLAAFKGESLRTHPAAPLALLQRASLLRGLENQAVVATRELAAARREQEKLAVKDPSRVGLVALLRQQYALALKDAGKFAEARALFDVIRKEGGDRTESRDSALRLGQCLRDEGQQALEKANQTLGMPDLPPADRAAAAKQAEAGREMVRQAVRHYEALAESWKKSPAAAALRLRALYEAVWIYRDWAGAEVEEARQKAPDAKRGQIELQPSEKRVRELYRELIAAAADAPLGQAAYLELAEIHAEREEFAAATTLLKQALDKEPSPELTAKVRLRLGALALAQNDVKAAQAHFAAAAADPNGPLAAAAAYRVGECLVQQNKWSEAVAQLLPFRDQEPLQNVGGVSDAALLRLGHSYARLKDWVQAKETQKALVARFGDSPWAAEAFYGIGQARQQLKSYDGALEAYGAAVGSGQTPAAARAQLGIGLCLIEQKKYAEALPALEPAAANEAYPEIGALALLESAHAAYSLKKPDGAKRLLAQLVEKYPKSAFVEKARKCLKTPKELSDPPHLLAAAAAVLTPTLPASPLESLGQQIADDGRDDPTVELARTMILARRPVSRSGPAAPARWETPDPFEHRLFFPTPDALPGDALPPLHVAVPPG